MLMNILNGAYNDVKAIVQTAINCIHGGGAPCNCLHTATSSLQALILDYEGRLADLQKTLNTLNGQIIGGIVCALRQSTFAPLPGRL